MFRLMKADNYRIRRSKTFYLLPAIITLFVAISCVIFLALNNMNSEMIGQTLQDISGGVSSFPTNAFEMTVINLQSDTLIYGLLGVFILVSGVDFSAGTIKNLLMVGVNKKKIFFSKLFTSYKITVIYYIIYFIASVGLSVLTFGWNLSSETIIDLLLIGAKQLPIYISIISIGHLFIFATQRTGISIILYLVNFMIINTFLPMVSMIVDLPFNISLLFPLYQCIELTKTSISTEDYLIVYGSALVYILVSWLVGYFKFKKTEIK